MELTLNNGFCEMTVDEIQNITGGFIIAVVAVGTATFTITQWACYRSNRERVCSWKSSR